MKTYFQTQYGTFFGVCSTTVLEKFSCMRTFAEQTTRTFLKLCLNYSKMLQNNSGALIECFYGMIFEELFYSFSRKFLKVCSESVLEEAKVYSRTVLEQTMRTFLELFWNYSKNVLLE